MYSGITILYLLFLKKQFSCVSDGLAIIGARCVLHVTALVLLSLSAGNQDLNSNLLALTYIFVVVINRGSTYILTPTNDFIWRSQMESENTREKDKETQV